ncbi:MAG: hypothetical protein HY856_19890 [Burkholderiales bacterium]|nr:hypothetical protein [Burkholderiales bacterium]
MSRLKSCLRVLTWAIALSAAGAAHAQATRTWVSGVGDDANPCSRTAPCKTFAGAISKTATGGQISTLDPGGYGSVTITKAISIVSEGSGEAGILSSFTNGVVVNAPTGSMVYLRGLQIEGAGSGLAGVVVISGDVHIENTSIRNFRGNPGVGIDNRATARSRVFVSNSSILGNLIGVRSNPTAVSPVFLWDTLVDRYEQTGLLGTGSFAAFHLNQATVMGGPVGISAPAPAKTYTYGNNVIGSLEAGTVLNPVALQ